MERLGCFSFLSNVAHGPQSSDLEQCGDVRLSFFTYSTTELLVDSYDLPRVHKFLKRTQLRNHDRVRMVWILGLESFKHPSSVQTDTSRYLFGGIIQRWFSSIKKQRKEKWQTAAIWLGINRLLQLSVVV
jgi:hypothetical protein